MEILNERYVSVEWFLQEKYTHLDKILFGRNFMN